MANNEVESTLPGIDADLTRCCQSCGKEMPLNAFSKHRRTCKKCLSEYEMRRRDQNPDVALNAHLKRKFGITLADYTALLIAQGGVCAICGQPPTVALGIPSRRQGRAVRPRLVVDHNHETGAVRGLLCSPCNRGIGFLGDTSAGVRAALAYLEREG